MDAAIFKGYKMVKIRDDYHKRLKFKSLNSGQTLQEFLNMIIRDYLSQKGK